MLNGWLLYNETDAERNRSYIDWFLEEARGLDMGLELVSKEELEIGVQAGSLYVGLRGDHAKLPDYCIMRNRDELLSAQLEALGVPVFNSSAVSRLANDKARTCQYLAQHGIPMPDTLFLNKTDYREQRYEGLAYPRILKAAGGRGGSEVYRVSSAQEITERLRGYPEGSAFVLQEMVTPGRDVRVFVVGKRIVGAVLRESDRDFRANHSLGGRSSLYTLTASEEELARRIIERFDFGMAGIDFIYGSDGTVLLNEIEDVVGSRTLSLHSNINIVRLYLEHIRETITTKD
ncbi:ATP-grasp domain-containing protein [Gorillibacterium timonense]|uniref:ATP-grasp domain-containing protein n=1 Tax=Gorillibacterium timonense TaxID=1689269 RepID=UPI00071D5305|nr:ATP-grasp domain-containing protein [Gorillibacterium timonense]